MWELNQLPLFMTSSPCSPHGFPIQQPAESLLQGAQLHLADTGSLSGAQAHCTHRPSPDVTSAEMALCQRWPWPQALWKFGPNSFPRLHPYSQRGSQGVAPCPPPSEEREGGWEGHTPKKQLSSQRKPESGERLGCGDREALPATFCCMFSSLFPLLPLPRMPYGTDRAMWALGGGRNV